MLSVWLNWMEKFYGRRGCMVLEFSTSHKLNIIGKCINKFKKSFHSYCIGGQRNWIQVICTAGVAANVAVLYMMETGCGEYAVNFSQS